MCPRKEVTPPRFPFREGRLVGPNNNKGGTQAGGGEDIYRTVGRLRAKKAWVPAGVLDTPVRNPQILSLPSLFFAALCCAPPYSRGIR